MRAGQTLTFNVQGSTGGYLIVDATDLRSGVIDALTKHFSAPRVDLKLDSLIDMATTGQFYHWDYAAQVSVTLRSDYGAAGDVGSIIANAFYVSGGALPTVSETTTGAALPGPGTDYGGSGIEQLLDPANRLVMMLVIGIIAIVAIIAFSPTGREAGRSLGKIRAV